jgi:RecB family endonuclease NucS
MGKAKNTGSEGEGIMNIYSHFAASGTKLEAFPFVSELAMEGYLAENPDILKLSDDDEVRIVELEKDWKRDGEGRGRIDLLASYGDSTFAVIELKKGDLDLEAFNQLKSYFKDKVHLRKKRFL